MAIEIDEHTALRIAELLDLFAELPSTPSPLTDEARQHVRTLMDAVQEETPMRPEDAHRAG